MRFTNSCCLKIKCDVHYILKFNCNGNNFGNINVYAYLHLHSNTLKIFAQWIVWILSLSTCHRFSRINPDLSCKNCKFGFPLNKSGFRLNVSRIFVDSLDIFFFQNFKWIRSLFDYLTYLLRFVQIYPSLVIFETIFLKFSKSHFLSLAFCLDLSKIIARICPEWPRKKWPAYYVPNSMSTIRPEIISCIHSNCWLMKMHSVKFTRCKARSEF